MLLTCMLPRAVQVSDTVFRKLRLRVLHAYGSWPGLCLAYAVRATLLQGTLYAMI